MLSMRLDRLVVFAAIALFIVLALYVEPVSAQDIQQFKAIYFTADAASHPNTIVEFSAVGRSGAGDLINVSNAGGYLMLSGQRIDVQPWNYVYWGKYKIWLIFLANVTKDDFSIGFLYLRDSSTAFGLRLFNYASGAYWWAGSFSGKEYVRNQTLQASSVRMPRLEINATAKTVNKLFAYGPSLYMTSAIGYMLNGSSRFTLYPLLNQINASTGWNELWTLMVDGSKTYYYSILYMNRQDYSHVMLGWTLRLNDYAAAPFRTYDASWSIQRKTYSLTVNTQRSNISVNVNGFPFRTDSWGRLQVPISSGLHTLELEPSIPANPGVRIAFGGWNDGSTSNPRQINVGGDLTLNAKFVTQYLLTAESPFTNVSGEGWYDTGSTAYISVEHEIDYWNGTRHVFTGWTGDLQSSNSSLSILMDNPKLVKANYKKQYQVRFNADGLPNGTVIEFNVNGALRNLTIPDSYSAWFDSGATVSFAVKILKIEAGSLMFGLESWHDSDWSIITSPLIVDKPHTLTASFNREKAASKIFCNIRQNMKVQGEPVVISGSIEPAHQDAIVKLYYSLDGRSWTQLTEVRTDSEGKYSYEWDSAPPGTVYLKADWSGDFDHKEAFSASLSFATSLSIALFRNWVHSTGEYVQRGLRYESFKFLLYPLSFAIDICNTIFSAFMEAQILSAVLAITVASLILGLAYLAPVLLLLMILATRGRTSRLKLAFLIPLSVLWALSLIGFLVAETGMFQSFAKIAVAGFIIMTIVLSGSIFSSAAGRIIGGLRT